MDTKILEDFGFSSRESKVYLALLETGSTTIGNIIKKTEIPSSKIYEVLDRLMNKGFVSYVIIKSQKHFQAADPENIIKYAEEKKKQLETLLPELKAKQKFAKYKQKVEIYEGKQSIFKLFHNLVDFANKGDEYLSFSLGAEHDDPKLVVFYSNLALRRQEKGLNIKVLTNSSVKEIYKKKYPRKVLSIIHNRFTDFDFPQGITILNENVIMLNWLVNPTAILINSHHIAEQYKKFFYQLYKNAKT